MTSREAMLFMKYEHYSKCKGSFKDSQRKCKYTVLKIDFTSEFQYERSLFTLSILVKVYTYYIYSIHDLII